MSVCLDIRNIEVTLRESVLVPICRTMQPPRGWFLQDDAASRFAGSCSHPVRGRDLSFAASCSQAEAERPEATRLLPDDGACRRREGIHVLPGASPTSAVRGIGCCNFNGLAAKVVTTSRWPMSLGAGVLAGAIPVVAIGGMRLCQV